MKSKHPKLPLLHKAFLMLVLMLLTAMGSGSVWGQSPVVITTDDNGNGTIEDSEKKYYLIQTNAFPSFFIAPQSNNTITTNNILGDYMLWYFLDAGTDNGTQYYYIVNNSTGNTFIIITATQEVLILQISRICLMTTRKSASSNSL